MGRKVKSYSDRRCWKKAVVRLVQAMVFGKYDFLQILQTEAKVNTDLLSSSVRKEDITDEKPLETVVETGPVQHQNEADHHDYHEDDEEDIVTASSLFAKQIDCKFL